MTERQIKIYYTPHETGPAERLGGRLARIVNTPLLAQRFWRDDVVRLTHLPGDADGLPRVEKVLFRRHADQRVVGFADAAEAMLLASVFALVGADADVLLGPANGQRGMMSVAFDPPLDPVALARVLGIEQDPEDDEAEDAADDLDPAASTLAADAAEQPIPPAEARAE